MLAKVGTRDLTQRLVAVVRCFKLVHEPRVPPRAALQPRVEWQ
jgi:hypothetical protein